MIKRGAIFTMAAKGAYTGKPRPAVVIQNEDLEIESVIVIPITSRFKDTPLIRVTIEPTSNTGLNSRSYAMCEKISTVPKVNLGNQIGTVDTIAMRQIEEALMNVLGFSEAP